MWRTLPCLLWQYISIRSLTLSVLFCFVSLTWSSFCSFGMLCFLFTETVCFFSYPRCFLSCFHICSGTFYNFRSYFPSPWKISFSFWHLLSPQYLYFNIYIFYSLYLLGYPWQSFIAACQAAFNLCLLWHTKFYLFLEYA